MTDRIAQLAFSFHKKRQVVADFSGGHLTNRPYSRWAAALGGAGPPLVLCPGNSLHKDVGSAIRGAGPG
jgi:hypothetical protein